MARVEEAKPWVESNSDGSPNRGSYRASAATWVVVTAVEIAGSHDVAEVAGKLMLLADAAQADLRADGGVNRQARSHDHALRLVLAEARQTPPVAGEVLGDWAARVGVEVLRLVKITADLDDQASSPTPLSTRLAAIAGSGSS